MAYSTTVTNLTEGSATVAALELAGRLALLHNDFARAGRWLELAATRPDHSAGVYQDLAEVYYRQDDFGRSAMWWRRISDMMGESAQRASVEPMAAKLESFGGGTPYRVGSEWRESRIPSTQVDPLPLVQVTLNGRRTVPFFIDTGGHEVIVGSATARSLGIEVVGETVGEFAGGKQATVGHGRLSSLPMADFVVGDLPINVIDLEGAGAEDGGVDVKGAIGTAFLYHFLSTIDYPSGHLVLRRRDHPVSERFRREASHSGTPSIPYWLSGTHFVLARGALNDAAETLLFIDTGGKDVAYTGPRAYIDEAGVKLEFTKAHVEHSGGGATRFVPFDIRSLRLGDVTRHNLHGVFMPETDSFVPDVIHEFGVGGLVSHEFFRPYEATFYFDDMRLVLKRARSGLAQVAASARTLTLARRAT